MTMWWFLKETHKRDEVRRVDWKVRLTKDFTSVSASELADFNFLSDAYTRQKDTIQARCRGILLLNSWSVSLSYRLCVTCARSQVLTTPLRRAQFSSSRVKAVKAPTNTSQDSIVVHT